MGLPPTYESYAHKDFDAVRERLFDLITSVFPQWTNTQKHNFGNILVEGFAFVADILNYYQDAQARETRFAFVEQRKNMIALCKLIGYELPGADAATADVQLTLTNKTALAGTVTIPEGTIVRTLEVTNPVKGELQADVVVDVVTGVATGPWEHSLTQPIYVLASSGLPDFEMYLPFGPYLDGTAVVSTPTQGVFTEVDNFLTSGPGDLHYTAFVDHLDRVTLRFGDGNNGAIPIGNVSARYKTGGGTDGNVEAGSLVKVEGNFTDTYGNTAYVESTNLVDAEGGIPREEVEAARVNAPASLRVLNRTVSREDYEINAMRVSGVGRALMLTSNEQSGIPENHGRLYIIPSTGGTPSTAMKDEVEVMCTETYPNTITFQLDVLDPAYLTIDVVAWVWLREGYQPSAVKASIEEALEDFFEPMLADGTANPNVDFGFYYKDADGNPAGEIAWSDIFNIVRDIGGVRKVGAGATEFTLNGVRDDVSIPNWKFPALGTVTVINGDTGTAI